MGLRSYYRQFTEMTPEEVSRELRERREQERRREMTEQPTLDLSGAAWHGPPHAEIVNAATFALRRAINAYPDDRALRDAIARANGVRADRVSIGHGAGELLRAALHRVARRGEVAVAWPGWGPLPGLVQQAGAKPLAVSLEDLFGGRVRSMTTVITRPGDPTGAVVGLDELRHFASAMAADAWLILDEALAGFLPDGEDGLIDHPRVIHVRSFSKSHAMAGFRIGYAIAEPDLSPVLGVGAPALAGALWAVENGAASASRRRSQAAEERERLVCALDDRFSVSPGHGPYVWLAGTSAEQLVSQRVLVAPGSAWGDDLHVRITLRDAAATDRLVAALRGG
jgi:histidinol-phosphate/aromatic aminotransferase/cobyric acid decarboxylase-like protein